MIDWDAAVAAPCMAVFGEKPDQRPMFQRAGGGLAFAIDGIFDDAYEALTVVADGDPGIATLNPVLGVRDAQFSGVPPLQGDTVTVPRAGKAYVVADVQADGHGITKLILQEKAP